MRAHLVQLDIAWEDPHANHKKVLRLLESSAVEPGDFILLPEMFDTGFSMNTATTADTKGVTLRFLTDLAKNMGATIQAGRTVLEAHAAKASNVMTVAGPDGSIIAEYQKMHPFTLGREHEFFAAGKKVIVYDLPPGSGSPAGVNEPAKVCPAICYDLRFPELFRRGLTLGAEVFALGACWPKTRQQHWRALLIARAIENQAIVLGVNRAGVDPPTPAGVPGLEYIGGSIAVGPMGDVLGELASEDAVLSVPLDIGTVRSWRGKFPAWKEAKLGEA